MRATQRTGLGVVLPLLLLFAALGATGCWQDKEEIASVVWSDDDAEHAYQLLLFEQNTTNPYPLAGSSRRNFRYQVYVQKADGSQRRAVSGVRQGRPGGFFFYMRRAGYVLLNVIESSTMTRLELIRTADGATTVLRTLDAGPGPVSPCQGVEALPSPDGTTIAVMERVAPAGNGCSGGSVIVDMLDAATLSVQASYEWTLDGMPGISWSREGELFVWTYAGGSWRVDPEAGPVAAPAPTCAQPRTSSSNISDDGVWIGGGDPDDDPVIVLATDATNCW